MDEVKYTENFGMGRKRVRAKRSDNIGPTLKVFRPIQREEKPATHRPYRKMKGGKKG